MADAAFTGREYDVQYLVDAAIPCDGVLGRASTMLNHKGEGEEANWLMASTGAVSLRAQVTSIHVRSTETTLN